MKKFIAAAIASLTMASPALADNPKQIAKDAWIANDSDGVGHLIEVKRMDREGDVLIWVSTTKDLTPVQYWVRCSNDTISEARADATWTFVDHRKMVGWYSDAACGRL